MYLKGIGEKQENPNVAELPVWPVPGMPREKAIIVDVEKPIGVSNSAFQIILDADIQRRQLARLGQRYTEGNQQALFRRLADLGAPSRFDNSDPLLWCVRVWRAIRKATLPFHSLQRDSQHAGDDPNDPRLTTGSTTYKLLAVRAATRWDGYEGFDKICHSVFDGAPGERVRSLGHSDYQAGHRFLWHTVYRAIHRQAAYTLARNSGFFPDWGAKVSTRYMDKAAVRYHSKRLRDEN